MAHIFQNRIARYLWAVLGIAAVTATCAPFQARLNSTTVALALLLVVLFVAAAWGRWPALFASVTGMLCFNFFFLPPLYTFTIADPQNWVALTAFLITALTAGQLSAWAKQRAAEAEASRSQARLASAYNRSLLEASLDPLMTIGHDGKINDVNAAAETVTGRSRAELIGTDFSDYFTEREKARTAYEQVFRDGFVRGYALDLRHRNGHSTSVLYDGSLYRNADGNVIGVVASARPIGTYAGKPAGLRPDPRIVRHLNLFVGFASLFSVAVGVLGLLGWRFHITILKSVIPGQVVIKPNAAACLVLIGLSLWLVRKNDDQLYTNGKRLCGQIIATITALVGLLSLAEHFTGWDLRIDQLLFLDGDPWEAFGSIRPGLIAPITALDFLLLGLAVLLLDRGISWRSRRCWPAQYLASLTAILSIVGLLDFVLESRTSYTHIALQTAVTLFLLSFALLCARTERGLPVLFASSTVGGSLTRRLLPAAVIIPIAIGALSWSGFSAGLYSEWGGLSLMIIAMITLLASLAIWNGYVVNRGDVERLRADGILYRREMELREAQRLAQGGSWWWDPKTDSVIWSAGLSHITWRDPMLPPPAYKEHLGFYTSQSSARLDAAIQSAIQTGAPYELDLEMVRGDGAIRAVTGRGEVERDADGQVVLVRGTVQDVTELKRAEAEVRSSAARHAATVQASLDAIIAVDARGGITEFNPAAEQMFGHRREDVLGREIADVVIPPWLRDRHRQGLARYLATGVAKVLGRRVELTAIRASGEEFPVELAIARIASAGPAQFTGYIRDITERKRSEEALRQSEASLNRAQEIAHIGSWHLDVGQNTLTWSDEVFRIFGIPKGTALTYQAFLTTIHPEDRESVERAWTAAIHGAPYNIEHRIVVGGALKWVRERAKVEFDKDGRAVEGIGTVQDVTERKRAEEEIRTLNAELEQRVITRTAQLQAANKELEQARERESEIGFRIQQTLLLDQPPRDVPGLRVAVLTIPSQRIDGDFYIFIRHSDECLDVIVGDVMGKGIPAALLGAATKTHFLKALSDLVVLCEKGKLPQPNEIVMLAHAELVQHLISLESFVTLCYARLDVKRRSLDLVDCGHTGLVQLHGRTGLCELLHGNNLPLGIREGEIFDQISIPFEPGDLLLLYSDGITEARNPARELFGVERLEKCVLSNGHLEPVALVEAIRKDVFTFSQTDRLADDLTSVAIRIEETQQPLAREETEIQSDLKQLRRAREFVRAFCHNIPGAPLDEASTGALELAVNEAASNIMKHAYHGRTDQSIHLDIEAFPGRVSVRLHHLGDPFDPSMAPPPAFDGSRESGFGAYVIAQSVDEVNYYRDERGRNCVALTIIRKS